MNYQKSVEMVVNCLQILPKTSKSRQSTSTLSMVSWNPLTFPNIDDDFFMILVQEGECWFTLFKKFSKALSTDTCFYCSFVSLCNIEKITCFVGDVIVFLVARRSWWNREAKEWKIPEGIVQRIFSLFSQISIAGLLDCFCFASIAINIFMSDGKCKWIWFM